MAARKKAAGGGWDELAVQPVGSAGLLQRHGDVVVLVSVGGDEVALDAVLATCRDATDGRRLVRQLAVQLADDEGDAPALVALAPTENGLATFVYGNAELTVSGDDGKDETLSGKRSSAWVDRVFDWPLQRVSAYVGKVVKDQPDARIDLYDGLVAASGVVISPRQAGVAKPARGRAAHPAKRAAAPVEEPTLVAPAEDAPPPLEPIVADEPAPEFESVLLVDTQADLSATPAAEPVEDAHDHFDHVLVQGIMCKRQHFNAPSAAFCGVCGISMVQQTHELVEGPRPPLGVIVFDDGSTFRVDDDYVIGREPALDPDVAAGRARGLAIVDDEGTVSRAHALIHLEGWDVRLIDRGSANGTYVAPPDTTVWAPLRPHEPVTIVPGTRVQVGRRTFVFDAHNRV